MRQKQTYLFVSQLFVLFIFALCLTSSTVAQIAPGLPPSEVCVINECGVQLDKCQTPCDKMSSMDENSVCNDRCQRAYDKCSESCRSRYPENNNSPNSVKAKTPKPENRTTVSPPKENRAAKEQEEEERAKERTRAFNEQKKCPPGKVCAGRAEISDTDANVDERTRAFNEQKKKKQRAAELIGNDLWIVEPNKEKGLIPGKNGEWMEGEFRVTCWGSDKLWAETTYLTAFVANSKGLASCTGAGVEISNASSKYPAYFGLHVINMEVLPRQTNVLPVPHYRSRRDKRMSVVMMRVKWWKPYAPQ